jgi:hypothetical protein
MQLKRGKRVSKTEVNGYKKRAKQKENESRKNLM